MPVETGFALLALYPIPCKAFQVAYWWKETGTVTQDKYDLHFKNYNCKALVPRCDLPCQYSHAYETGPTNPPQSHHLEVAEHC